MSLHNFLESGLSFAKALACNSHSCGPLQQGHITQRGPMNLLYHLTLTLTIPLARWNSCFALLTMTPTHTHARTHARELHSISKECHLTELQDLCFCLLLNDNAVSYSYTNALF